MTVRTVVRLLTAVYRSALVAELREDLAAINVNKPYKPRRLKMDMVHTIARRLAKIKRRNPTYKRRIAIQRKKYMLHNGRMLKKRAQKVNMIREQRGLD
jgi:hypothetical protein